MGKHKPFILLGPGDTIKEELDFYGWEQKDLAEILGISEKHVSQLLNNKVPITFEMACQLSGVFKQSPQFWLNLDANYRLQLENIAQSKETSARALIYRYMPIRELRKRGWLSDKKENLANEVIRFWGIKILQFDFLEEKAEVYFRKSEVYHQFNRYFALTWLQMAKNLIAKKKIKYHFNPEKLSRIVAKLPDYTIHGHGVNDFINDLLSAGIIFQYLPHLEKTYTDGASFWHRNNPVIVYTARYDRQDNFWFTMAHETGHVLLHRDSAHSEFIDSLDHLDTSETLEKEADDFAKRHLKIKEILRFFKDAERISRKRVLSCADLLGLHPGIVVGCLQHEGKLRFNSLNDLKEPVRTIIEKYK